MASCVVVPPAAVIAVAAWVTLSVDAAVAGLNQASALAGMIAGICRLIALLVNCQGISAHVASDERGLGFPASLRSLQSGLQSGPMVRRGVRDGRECIGVEAGNGYISAKSFPAARPRR